MKLTTAQEKDYLLDLLFEAARYRDVPMDSPYSAIELEIRDRIQRLTSAEDDTDARWNRSEDDPDSIHLEVQDRLSRLTAVEEPVAEDDDKPVEEPEPEPESARPAPKQSTPKSASFKERKRLAAEKYRELNVRCQIDGKPVWKLRSECIQVPIGNGRFRWEWRPEQAQDKVVDKLGDELWVEHERSN